jgi:hypothetical protein
LELSEFFKGKKMNTIEAKYQEKCATPSDINQHLPTLRQYAEQCRHVTEMGVRTIVSTWAFLAAKPEHGVLSIDYIHPTRHGGNLDEVLELACMEGVIFNFVEADTRTVEIPPTDLLFIDTWHVYEQLKVELERHAPKAKQFIILHDTETFGERGETEGHRGLRPARDEFLAGEEGQKWFVLEHFKNCNGLTILERRA